jgi:Brp/Blh family beta-carotene 15,15'-monooxygenase
MLFRHLDLLAGVHELANWLILFALFLNTPLMMGFAVYFSLWHALPSIIEQIGFLKKNQLKYSFHKHVLNIAPYTLLSIGGIFLGLYFLKDSSLAAQTGIGFMFLSIITMPHILLMDRFHELNAENAPSSDFTRTATT